MPLSDRARHARSVTVIGFGRLSVNVLFMNGHARSATVIEFAQFVSERFVHERARTFSDGDRVRAVRL